MNVKKGLLLKEVAGNYIVVAVGSAVKVLNGAITLNETGALLWKLLENGTDFDTLVNTLTSEYGVEKSVAIKDVGEFLDKLQKADLLA